MIIQNNSAMLIMAVIGEAGPLIKWENYWGKNTLASLRRCSAQM